MYLKAIILGAGRIRRGFVSELLHANQAEITYFDVSSVMVDKLSEKKEYTIHALGAEELNTHMEGVQVYLFYDIDALCSCWKGVDFLFTACGGRNMGNVGETFAKTFKRLVEENAVHVSNIVTCENWINPTKDLKEAIASNLNEEERKLFEENVGVSESVIMCIGIGAPDPDKVANRTDTWIQNIWYLPTDRDRTKGKIPQWDYVESVTDLGDLLKQKTYTNSTSAATVSYPGKPKGLTYVVDSANDPEIESILDQVYEEINYALIHGVGINEKSQIKFSKTAKAKYTDRATVDPTTCIVRDPIRKLGPQDCSIGPMRIALSARIRPKAIALSTAAALYLDNPEDRDVLRLKEIRETRGIDYILETISEISPQGEIAVLIKEIIVELEVKDWIKEGASAWKRQLLSEPDKLAAAM